MGNLRAKIGRGEPVATVKDQIAVLDMLFSDAEAVLSPDAASTAFSFIGALTILLREGVEGCCQSNANLSPLSKCAPRVSWRYAVTPRHCASAAERRSL